MLPLIRSIALISVALIASAPSLAEGVQDYAASSLYVIPPAQPTHAKALHAEPAKDHCYIGNEATAIGAAVEKIYSNGDQVVCVCDLNPEAQGGGLDIAWICTSTIYADGRHDIFQGVLTRVASW